MGDVMPLSFRPPRQESRRLFFSKFTKNLSQTIHEKVQISVDFREARFDVISRSIHPSGIIVKSGGKSTPKAEILQTLFESA